MCNPVREKRNYVCKDVNTDFQRWWNDSKDRDDNVCMTTTRDT